MRPYTPEKKRVRTSTFSQVGVTNATTGQAQDSKFMTFEDDIRIIGLEVCIEMLVQDPATNTDGLVNGFANIYNGTQQLIRVEQCAVWNAVFSVGRGGRSCQGLMLPGDYGIDKDEGDSLELRLWFETVCSVSITAYANGIVYWVER